MSNLVLNILNREEDFDDRSVRKRC